MTGSVSTGYTVYIVGSQVPLQNATDAVRAWIVVVA